MPYSEIGGELIYFCHVPKTGGRSIEHWMEQTLGNLHFMDASWTDGWKRGGWRRGGIGTSRQHMDWQTASTELGRNPDHVFAVVRDPVSRIKSEYHFQSRHRRKRRALAGLGFSRWCRIMYVAHGLYPKVFDNHFRSQSDLVPEQARVFRFEDGLEAVTDWLRRLAPAGVPDAALRGPESYGNKVPIEVTAADRALIEAWYAEDYERFGFQRSATGPIPAIPFRDRALGALVALAFRIGRL